MSNDSASFNIEVPTALSMRSRVARFFLLILALISLAVAGIGVVVPGLPTTEFVLLSAWAASKSSPRLHNWLQRNRVFGPLLEHWRQGRLPRRAKWAATGTMSLAAAVLILSVEHLPSVVFSVTSMACVLIWLWRRPEPSEGRHSLGKDDNQDHVCKHAVMGQPKPAGCHGVAYGGTDRRNEVHQNTDGEKDFDGQQR